MGYIHGNTTGSGGTAYAYDFENRLTAQNGGAVTIVYDGDGNRVAKTVGGVTTQYLVDDRNLTGYAQVLEEIVNGTVQRVYTYGLDLISQNQLLGSSQTVSFYGYDGYGSVRFLIDAAGNVTDTYTYDAFGNLIHVTGVIPNVYLYAGEQLDPNISYYYLRARYLASATGRFTTGDPEFGIIFDPQSLHRYTYAANNPVLLHDPTGRFSTFVETVATTAITSMVFELYSTYVIPRVFGIKDKLLPDNEEIKKITLAGLAGAAGGIVSGTLGAYYAGRFASAFSRALVPVGLNTSMVTLSMASPGRST